MFWRKAIFILLVLVCLSPIGSPPLALALGLALALSLGNPYPQLAGKPVRYLLQASVVLLGFGMNLEAVYKAGRDGLAFTIVTIAGTLIVGFAIGRVLAVRGKTSALISSGTAICGGSAIAAVAPAIDAEPEEISIALGTVFMLNALALFLFPLIGHALAMSDEQFGIWAAVAIHDTSSVVGAGQAFSEKALAIATTVKLTRALWIAPVALLFAVIYRRLNKSETTARIGIPWFILFFVLAAAVRTYTPSFILPSIFDSLVNLAKAGLTLTLFLIGASLGMATLKAVGVRPLVQGIILWVLISAVSLAAVMSVVRAAP